jgi:hypothetical protein
VIAPTASTDASLVTVDQNHTGEVPGISCTACTTVVEFVEHMSCDAPAIIALAYLGRLGFVVAIAGCNMGVKRVQSLNPAVVCNSLTKDPSLCAVEDAQPGSCQPGQILHAKDSCARCQAILGCAVAGACLMNPIALCSVLGMEEVADCTHFARLTSVSVGFTLGKLCSDEVRTESACQTLGLCQ